MDFLRGNRTAQSPNVAESSVATERNGLVDLDDSETNKNLLLPSMNSNHSIFLEQQQLFSFSDLKRQILADREQSRGIGSMERPFEE